MLDCLSTIVSFRYKVDFINNKTGQICYTTNIDNNCWCRFSIQYFIEWKIVIYENGVEWYSMTFNAEGKRVYIAMDSKALGDSLAWIPYVQEFKKQHNCEVIVSTFMNDMFLGEYPDIEFVEPGTIVYDIVGHYKIGLFYNNDELDMSRHFNDVKKEPLQKIASDILGLDYIEERPKVVETKPSTILNKKYVCIAPHATALAKYWNRPNG